MVLGQPHLNIPYSPTQAVSSSRSSLFKTIVDFFPRIRRRRDKQEGIIVTHTPSPSAPSTPYAATFSVPIGPGSSLPLSPHSLSTDSLHPRSSEEIMPRNRISLRAPPKRSATNPTLNVDNGGAGLTGRSSDEISVGFSSTSLHTLQPRDETPFRRRTSAD